MSTSTNTHKRFWWPAIITLRILLFVIILTASVATLILTTKAALATDLRDVSIVSDDVLRVKDLFEGVKRNADYVLGPAPQPGKDMVLNARTLYRIATAMNLDWRPYSSSQQLVVRRAATIVSRDTLNDLLRASLEEKGLNGQYKLIYTSRLKDIVLPVDMDAAAEIEDISFDPGRDLFKVSFAAPSIDNPVRQYAVAGQVERLIDIPVLRSSLSNGDIIGKNDIDFVTLPQKSVQRGLMTDAKDVYGLTPRRMLLPGKPILSNELERPKLVDRGDTITIFFKNGSMVLSTKGKALQSGAKGDYVRVSNINSSKSLTAYVSGDHEVTVQ